jgi:gamma-butyrobetaine dioxygenase
MQIETATLGPMALHIDWADGSFTDFPYLWLRDNCPSAFHPQTKERQFDLLSVPEDLRPDAVVAEDGTLAISWPGMPPPMSRFTSAWLYDHRPGRAVDDPADLPPVTWGRELTIQPFKAAELLADDTALLDFLRTLRRQGLALVTGLAADPEAGMAVARRVGFLRETNFGLSFEVMNKPDPNNLAYTAEALPFHTDLPNLELAPGIQFLHCLANEAEGGESLFADGFRVVESLRAADPEAFDLLVRIPVPFHFHDETCDIRSHHAVIGLDPRGRLSELRFSAHLAAPFDMAADLLPAYYRAFRRLMAETREPRHRVRLKLQAGEMAVFDNRRILHGRERFLPNTGFRHLKGFYVDRGELDSRLRVLSRGHPA